MAMKLFFSSFLLLILFSSCQEDPKARAMQQEKEMQKRETIFNTINNGWNFNAVPSNQASRNLLAQWTEWRNFIQEIGQKPKSSIGAFQQKAKTLSKKAAELTNNVPIAYDIPAIKSRIAVITTKINSINLYIHLNQIPEKKIVQLIQEVNTELASMNAQLDEIKQLKEIKIEEGEGDMLRMLDTTRAIPTHPNPKTK